MMMFVSSATCDYVHLSEVDITHCKIFFLFRYLFLENGLFLHIPMLKEHSITFKNVYTLRRQCNSFKIKNKPFIGWNRKNVQNDSFDIKIRQRQNICIYMFLYILVGVCHGTILQHPAAINGYLLSTGRAASG